MSFFISDAFAAAPTSPMTTGSGYSSLIMLGIFVVVFYFLMLRPQQKRAKEHRNMINAIAKGDEVITNGGLLGKVSDIGEQFITLSLADNLEIKVQKSAVTAVVPKGTLKTA